VLRAAFGLPVFWLETWLKLTSDQRQATNEQSGGSFVEQSTFHIGVDKSLHIVNK
jgi:hypothetical protein